MHDVRWRSASLCDTHEQLLQYWWLSTFAVTIKSDSANKNDSCSCGASWYFGGYRSIALRSGSEGTCDKPERSGSEGTQDKVV